MKKKLAFVLIGTCISSMASAQTVRLSCMKSLKQLHNGSSLRWEQTLVGGQLARFQVSEHHQLVISVLGDSLAGTLMTPPAPAPQHCPDKPAQMGQIDLQQSGECAQAGQVTVVDQAPAQATVAQATAAQACADQALACAPKQDAVPAQEATVAQVDQNQAVVVQTGAQCAAPQCATAAPVRLLTTLIHHHNPNWLIHHERDYAHSHVITLREGHRGELDFSTSEIRHILGEYNIHCEVFMD